MAHSPATLKSATNSPSLTVTFFSGSDSASVANDHEIILLDLLAGSRKPIPVCDSNFRSNSAAIGKVVAGTTPTVLQYRPHPNAIVELCGPECKRAAFANTGFDQCPSMTMGVIYRLSTVGSHEVESQPVVSSVVRGIRFRSPYVILVGDEETCIYYKYKNILQISTVQNLSGLSAIVVVPPKVGPPTYASVTSKSMSSSEMSSNLSEFRAVCATLNNELGTIRIHFFTDDRYIDHRDISCKSSGSPALRIQCMTLNEDGSKIAVADEYGIDISVFNTADGSLARTFRRGTAVARILTLSFSSGGEWLSVSSDRGTTHFFSLKAENVTSWFRPLASFLPARSSNFVSSEWSKFQYRGAPGVEIAVMFGTTPNTLFAITGKRELKKLELCKVSDGSYTVKEVSSREF